MAPVAACEAVLHPTGPLSQTPSGRKTAQEKTDGLWYVRAAGWVERLLFLLLPSLSTLPSIFMIFGKVQILISWQNMHTDGICAGPCEGLFCTHSFHWVLKDIVGDLKRDFLNLRRILHKKDEGKAADRKQLLLLSGLARVCSWHSRSFRDTDWVTIPLKSVWFFPTSPLVSSYAGPTVGSTHPCFCLGWRWRCHFSSVRSQRALGWAIREAAKCHPGRIPYEIQARDPG